MPEPKAPRDRLAKSDGPAKSTAQLRDEIRLGEARDRSYSRRSVVRAFLKQHGEDLAMRRRYAVLLIRILIGQAIAINVLVIFVGFGHRVGFDLDPWTARSFVFGVFAEVCVFVGVVARYLFAPSADRILDVIERSGDARRAREAAGTEVRP